MTSVPPPIAFRSGLTAWAHSFGSWRIELASSAHDAPLYLATDGARIRWVHAVGEATRFETSSAAWDLVHAEQLAESVRVTC
ncbi:hypothetical protein [Methylobacterium sp. D48H]